MAPMDRLGHEQAGVAAGTSEQDRLQAAWLKRLAATHTKFFKPLADETEAVVGCLQLLVEANKLG
jgi:hypothetical protein